MYDIANKFDLIFDLILENDIATIGAAYPTEIEKSVAVADVAGSSEPAVTGAGGPVVAGTPFLAVTDITGADPTGTEDGGPVGTGTQFWTVMCHRNPTLVCMNLHFLALISCRP